MAKSKTTVPKDEKPEARCIRVIQPRVGKALKTIRLVGAVTDAHKLLTPKHKEEIIGVLEQAVREVKHRFAGQGAAASGFTLS